MSEFNRKEAQRIMKISTPRNTSKGIDQEFKIKAPGARAVLLAADFTHWQEQALPMKLTGNGVWGVSVALPPGTYQYRFIVDGEWCDDPECTQRVPNIHGSENTVREVPPTQRHGNLLPTLNRGAPPINRKRGSAARSKTAKPQPIIL